MAVCGISGTRSELDDDDLAGIWSGLKRAVKGGGKAALMATPGGAIAAAAAEAALGGKRKKRGPATPAPAVSPLSKMQFRALKASPWYTRLEAKIGGAALAALLVAYIATRKRAKRV